MFYQTPDLFLAFLESDFKQICRIGNHKLNYQLEKIKLEAWIDFFKTWCLRQVERTDHKFVDNSWVIIFFNESFNFFILTFFQIKDLPYGFDNKNKEIIQEILKENQEEMQNQNEYPGKGGAFLESQDLSKLSDSVNRRMKDIKEEEEEFSSLSNSKLDDLPIFKKFQFSMETPSKFMDAKEPSESREETWKIKTAMICCAIIDKFKGVNPYSIYTDTVIFLKK